MQKIIDCLEENRDKIDKVFEKDVDEDLLLIIAGEECAELIQALTKLERYSRWFVDASKKQAKEKNDKTVRNLRVREMKRNNAIDNLAEEIADVLIGISWIKELTEVTDEDINRWIKYKADRISDRTERGEFY